MSASHEQPEGLAGPPTDGWALFQRYEEQLRRLAAWHASADSRLAVSDLDDLLQEFGVRLAQRTFAAPLLAEGAYIRAAFRNFLRDWRQAKLREEAALQRLREQPADDASSDSNTGSSLPNLVATLPEPQGTAAALYLGLDGRPRSVREIADELGLTRYRARRATIDGLLAAAAALGHAGRLSPVQLEAARLVLLEGFDEPIAAEHLGIQERSVRLALQRARHLVGASFSNREKSR